MNHYVSPSAKKVIDLAKSQVGYHEGRDPNGNWNNQEKYAPDVPSLTWAQGQPWCAVFVSWLATKTGFANIFPITASTDAGAAWYKKNGRWSTFPAIGAQGFLGVNGNMDHTFLVTDFDDLYIYTVEGNSNTSGSTQGDGVYAEKRLRKSANIQGYGYPDYPEGIVSADPNFKGRVASASTPPAPSPAPADPSKTPAADRAYQDAQQGFQHAKGNPAKRKIWRSILNALKPLSSKY